MWQIEYDAYKMYNMFWLLSRAKHLNYAWQQQSPNVNLAKLCRLIVAVVNTTAEDKAKRMCAAASTQVQLFGRTAGILGGMRENGDNGISGL